MLKFLTQHKFALITITAAAVVLTLLYGEVLFAPNDYLFSAEGDGIKNYYTYLYHAKYDTNFHEFTGMNYPYYEHIVYTDAHPLLSWLIGLFGLAPYGIGILNFLMLASYPIAALFLFKILKHYKVSEVWAVAGAVVIAFMSPQVFRMTGHFSMAYACAIPIFWWLLIKTLYGNKIIWSLILAVYASFFFFTHPYLGMILVTFSAAFWLVYWIVNRGVMKTALLQLSIQVVLPIVFFRGFVALTDTHLDRLSRPAGFFQFYADWKSVLVAHHGPINDIFNQFGVRMSNWETWAYVGFGAIIFSIIIAVNIWLKRKTINFKDFFKQELVLFFIAAYFILLFAFCFPLKYDWMHWVTDLVGPLKQFRVLGRFAWIFFYVFTIASIVGMYRLHSSKGGPVFKWVYFAGILFYFFEFAPMHVRVAQHVAITKNSFKTEHVSPELKEVIAYIDEKGEYTAALFLPMQHMSSENIMMLGDEETNKDGFLLSYHCQLPLVNSVSSRMSLTEAINVNNYFSPGFMEKELTYDFPDDAKIIIVKTHGLCAVEELRMIWESEQLFENEAYTLFELDIAAWNSRERFDKVMAQDKAATVNLNDGWRSDSANVWFYYESFDAENKLTETKPFSGKGAFKDFKNQWNTILTVPKANLPTANCVVKFWVDLRVDRPDLNAVVQANYVQKDSTGWIADFKIGEATVIVNKWCLVEMSFSVTEDITAIDILLTGNGNGEPFVVDELLIQKENDAALFRHATSFGKEYVVYNNYWLAKDAFSNQ